MLAINEWELLEAIFFLRELESYSRFFQDIVSRVRLLPTLPKTCQAKSYSSATYDSTEKIRIIKTVKGHFVKNTFS